MGPITSSMMGLPERKSFLSARGFDEGIFIAQNLSTDISFFLLACATLFFQDVDFSSRIDWEPSDPNILTLRLPGGCEENMYAVLVGGNQFYPETAQ